MPGSNNTKTYIVAGAALLWITVTGLLILGTLAPEWTKAHQELIAGFLAFMGGIGAVIAGALAYRGAVQGAETTAEAAIKAAQVAADSAAEERRHNNEKQNEERESLLIEKQEKENREADAESARLFVERRIARHKISHWCRINETRASFALSFIEDYVSNIPNKIKYDNLEFFIMTMKSIMESTPIPFNFDITHFKEHEIENLCSIQQLANTAYHQINHHLDRARRVDEKPDIFLYEADADLLIQQVNLMIKAMKTFIVKPHKIIVNPREGIPKG